MIETFHREPEWTMAVAETHGGARVAIVVDGELDATRCAEFKQELLGLLELRKALMLDLSQVDFCSVACIEAIAEIATLAEERAIQFSIFAPRSVARCLMLYEPTPNVVTLDEAVTESSQRRALRLRVLEAS